MVALRSYLFGIAAACFSWSGATACPPEWLPGFGLRGTDGTVNASIEWDPDGPGPEHAKLVIGGNFTIAGNVLARNIAAYDPESKEWFALGAGTGGLVYALAVDSQGGLIAGGSFTTAGGQSARRVARWNGSSWSEIGGGIAAVSSVVRAIVVAPNGDLVVAGSDFGSLNGTPSGNVRRWNGESWSAVGTRFQTPVYALAVRADGELFAGGNFYFTLADGRHAWGISRWDGSDWLPLGSGFNNDVRTLTFLPDGRLVAGGAFTNAVVPAQHAAVWDGESWSGLGDGVSGLVASLAVQDSGHLIVGGSFSMAGGAPAGNFASWDGVHWSSPEDGIVGTVLTVSALQNGRIAAGGAISEVGGLVAEKCAIREAGRWLPPGRGLNGEVDAIAVISDSEFVVGGKFTLADDLIVNRVARWNGEQWVAMGAGIDGHGLFPTAVYALAVLPNGAIVASGRFDSAGGEAANCIAVWNGVRWRSLSDGLYVSSLATIYQLAVLPNGDLIASGGSGNISRWDGAGWSSLGQEHLINVSSSGAS